MCQKGNRSSLLSTISLDLFLVYLFSGLIEKRKMKQPLFLIAFTIFLFLINACQTTESEKKSADQITKNPEESKLDFQKKIILCYGNSITAGYELDIDQAFPALIQRKIDSLKLSYNVINAGLSGETSASGKSRIEWTLQTVPDIFMLELGANDALRGLPLDQTRNNLKDIIDQVKQVNPQVKLIIAGMKVPPNLGQEYTSAFENLFPSLAKEYDAILIPFILENVAGIPELNLRDGIHPTAEGHKIISETIWEYLNPLLTTNP